MQLRRPAPGPGGGSELLLGLGFGAEASGGGWEVVAVAEVVDRDDGTYGVSYCCTVAGLLELHVEVAEGGGLGAGARVNRGVVGAGGKG